MNINITKWMKLSGNQNKNDAREIKKMLFELYGSHKSLDNLNHALSKNTTTHNNFQDPDVLSYCLLAATKRKQKNVVKAILDFSLTYCVELSLKKISPAFNYANEHQYLDILDLIDERTHIVSDTSLNSVPFDEAQTFIESSIKAAQTIRIRWGSSLFDLFPELLNGPMDKNQKLHYKYDHDPLFYAFNRTNNLASITYLLDKPCELAPHLLELNLISACDNYKDKIIFSLIHHPKSRAIISTSNHIQRYLTTQPAGDCRNNLKNNALILLEQANLKEELDLALQGTLSSKQLGRQSKI